MKDNTSLVHDLEEDETAHIHEGGFELEAPKWAYKGQVAAAHRLSGRMKTGRTLKQVVVRKKSNGA